MIAKLIIENNISCVVVTDHDKLNGSVSLKRYCKKLGLNVEIPIAAEYKTDVGDIIAVNIEKPIISRSIKEFIQEVKSQGGITILPHPFDSHKFLEEWVEKIDIIEVFNSRSSDVNNKKSLELADELCKPKIYGADAHFKGDITNVIMTWNSPTSFLDAVFEKTIACNHQLKTSQAKIVASNIVKNTKLLRFHKVLWLILKLVYFYLKDYQIVKILKKILINAQK